MQVTVKVPGSCGELIQGMMGEANFLVTCPVNSYSILTAKKNTIKEHRINLPGKNKLLKALSETVRALGLDTEEGYDITLDSGLLIGKGMASSTADMTAAIIAIASLNKKKISHEMISRILLKIEPSDGIFYPGIVAFDHIHGSFYEKTGQAFDVNFLIYDFGGEVDTISFNSDPYLEEKNLAKKEIIEKAYFILKDAFAAKDIKKLGQAATMSALANQSILHKKNLEEIIQLSLSYGAYGVNIAHSGTLIGIINNKESKIDLLKEAIKENFPFLELLGNYKLVDGGYQID